MGKRHKPAEMRAALLAAKKRIVELSQDIYEEIHKVSELSNDTVGCEVHLHIEYDGVIEDTIRVYIPEEEIDDDDET